MKKSTLQDRMQSEGMGTVSSQGGEKIQITEEFEEFDQKVFDELQKQKQKEEDKPIKKAEENELKGGVGDKETIESLAKKHNVEISQIKDQLHIGIKTEMEHTDDPQKALEIVMDHLTESAEYYTKLEEMESTFKEEN